MDLQQVQILSELKESDTGSEVSHTTNGGREMHMFARSTVTSITGVGNVSEVSHQAKAARTAVPLTRLWSDLPPDPPCRDSWVSTNTFADMEKIKPRGSPGDFRPKEHGLARTHDSWV